MTNELSRNFHVSRRLTRRKRQNKDIFILFYFFTPKRNANLSYRPRLTNTCVLLQRAASPPPNPTVVSRPAPRRWGKKGGWIARLGGISPISWALTALIVRGANDTLCLIENGTFGFGRFQGRPWECCYPLHCDIFARWLVTRLCVIPC